MDDIDLHADFPFNFHENRGRLKNVTWPVLYTRHSMCLLLICLALLTYFGTLELGGEHFSNIGQGVKALIGVYICVGGMVYPSGPFTSDQMRVMLSWIDPSLGVEIPDKDYAEDCSLTYENVHDKSDIFIVAHFIGWIVKAIVLRDRLLCWVISILWEFVEISTAYFIPNFAECWWDQWIMDVLLCNGLGIECGLLFLRLYETDCPRFQWVPFMSIEGLSAKFERARQQFIPVNWEQAHWENANILFRFLFYNIVIILGSLYDMNLFMLKLWLWIPTDHPIILARTFLFGGVMMVSTRQGYFFCTDEKCDFLGSQAWICVLTLCVELMIAYKASPPIPVMPAGSFYTILSVCMVWGFISFLALRRWSSHTAPKEKPE